MAQRYFSARKSAPLTFAESTLARENQNKFCFSARLFVPLHPQYDTEPV